MADERKPDNNFTEEKLLWFLATAYLADVAGLLDEDKRLKLDELGEQYGQGLTWQQHIEQRLGINADFVNALYSLCIEHGKTERQALGFMLRGFGCDPASVNERLSQVLG
jgi:hypothetical protein